MEFEGEEEVLVRSRRIIEPVSGFIRAQRRWRPHPHNQQVEYSKFSHGLDWESRLRYLEPTSGHWRHFRKHPLVAWPGKRPLPSAAAQTEAEWLHNPNNDAGLRSWIRGNHQATKQTSKTLFLEKEMGKKRTLTHESQGLELSGAFASGVGGEGGGGRGGEGGGRGGIGNRNFIPLRAGGDKPYLTPEYEKDFHKKGSTRPKPHFGRNAKGPGIVIPIQSSGGGRGGGRGRDGGGGGGGAVGVSGNATGTEDRSESRCIPYSQKEFWRRSAEVVEEVALLESWRPATPLVAAGKDKDDATATQGQNTAGQTSQQKTK